MDLDKLIDKHYGKDKSQNLWEQILRLTEEIMGEPLRRAGDLQQVNEQAAAPRTKTYTIKEIPYIPISELGWANNDAGAEGPTQRGQLEGFLRNIGTQGGTLEQKLKSVQIKMTEGFGDIPKPEDGAGIKKYIQEVMAYLVFYKSLTMAITNFNASAAGFNFEAFLAALMGGEQISASQTGDSTIADFVTSDGIPISLKLYTHGTLKVGGSFTDIVHDMVNPKGPHQDWVGANSGFMGGAMRYVVCTKEFGEEEPGGEWSALDPKVRKEMDQRELHGKIRFWEFDITRKNFFDIMSKSKHGSWNIMSSQRLMDVLRQWNPGDPEPAISTQDGAALPQKSDDSEQAVAQILADMKDGEFGLQKRLAPRLKELNLDDAQAEAVMRTLYMLYQNSLTSQIGISAEGRRFMTYHIKINPTGNSGLTYTSDLKAALADWPELANNAKQIALDAVTPWWKEFKEGYLKEIDVRTDAINAMDWVKDPAELVKLYNALGDDAAGAERRRIALLNTRGYLTSGNWELAQETTKSLSVPKIVDGKKTFPPFATLEIGAPAVAKVLEQVRNSVMNEVFMVFENMQLMSENLNTFFASGLTDTQGTGQAGVEAGETATQKAKEVGDIDGSN